MTFVRPQLDLGEFRDEDGELIAYGHRWGSGQPREDTYSVTAHPERFRPLHDVAEALIEHLATTYDVSVADEPGQPDWLDSRVLATRTVIVQPASDDSAAVTFVFTAFPGLVLRLGAEVRVPVPMCACDACDDAVEHDAEELENYVFAVVGGGFIEYSDGYEVSWPDGAMATGERRPPARPWAAWPAR